MEIPLCDPNLPRLRRAATLRLCGSKVKRRSDIALTAADPDL
jgi:hypothetical protein